MRIFSLTLILVFLTGCGGGGGGSDAVIPVSTVAPPTILELSSLLDSDNVIGESDAEITASGTLGVNTDTDLITDVFVNVENAEAVAIHFGYAGQVGELFFNLQEISPGEWHNANLQLSSDESAQVLSGGMYAMVTTDDGDLRGQFLGSDTVVYNVELSGDEEVPAVQTDAFGQAGVTLNAVSNEVFVHVTNAGADDASAAHVHQAFAGSNGGVLFGLEADASDSSHWSANEQLDESGLAALQAGELYLNVHTPANPGGELRGQIVPGGISVVLDELSGEQEVPTVDTAAMGTVAVTLNAESGAVVIHVNTAGVDDATAAHLHQAAAGANGGVLVALMQDPDNIAHWSVSDTLDADGIAAVSAGETYINVHTPANPGGELRGQVVPDGIDIVFTELSGQQEVPAVTTSATATAALTFNNATSGVTVHINTSGVDDATAAHIHQGFAGSNGGVIASLEKDANDPAHWSVVTTLDEAATAAAEAGELYYNVHTPANPGGELRGQIVPGDVDVIIVPLSGAQEVPAVATTASGSVALTFNDENGDFVVNVNTSGVDDATAAHIHQGIAGTNGGVVAALSQDAETLSHWSAEGTLDEDGQEALEAGELYINVHTPANPGGELRGQLTGEDVVVMFAPLSGDQEVPAVTTTASGSIAATYYRESSELVVHINTAGVDDATAAHVHRGFAGTNGGVVFGLNQDADDSGHWWAMATLDADTVPALWAGELYVNVHTPANPSGELRGQILPDNVWVAFAGLSGDQEVPAVATNATGSVAVTYNASLLTAVIEVSTTGVDDATAAHLHQGAAGTNGGVLVALTQDAENVARWFANTPLDADGAAALQSGDTYINVHTPANPGGELRGQVSF